MAFALTVGCVVLGFLGASMLYLKLREKRLEGFPGLTREEFAAHFSDRGVPPLVSTTVYDTFKEKVKSKNFKPSPEMSIEQVFEQLGEDTDDDARHILKVLGIPKPTDEKLESWPGEGVRTVSDMVVWTDWVRRNQ